MRVEDEGMLPDLFGHLVLDRCDLLFCSGKGVLEAIHLPGHLLLVYEVLV